MGEILNSRVKSWFSYRHFLAFIYKCTGNHTSHIILYYIFGRILSANQWELDMFPGTWGCPRHVRFACHTSSMHIQWTKAKSKHQKQQYLFLISSKFVMVSKFNIYTVHLKCFDSIRYHLNQYKTLTKNFNQGLNSGELVWKMAKSKHQKQH